MTKKKLYELPPNTRFQLLEQPKVPPASNEVSDDLGVVYKLKNIDGMYSYCTVVHAGRCTDVKTNEVHHFAAWTEVEAL
jgi:hypothetical protein